MKSKILLLSLTTALTLFTTGVHAHIDNKKPSDNLNLVAVNTPTPIKTTSAAAEIGLAEHLKKVGAKMYGLYWSPKTTKQKELFGQQAFTQINYIECDIKGNQAQLDLCKKTGLKGYPGWEINGKIYGGVRSLNNLAKISNYKGQQKFKN